MLSELTHINNDGEASMVDVGDKDIISRVAIASGFIRLKGSTLDLISVSYTHLTLPTKA